MVRDYRSSLGLVVWSLLLLGSLSLRAADPNVHLQQVRAYAEALLQHGRDTYGPRHSPLIVTCMNLPDFRHLDRENPHTALLNEAGYRPKDAVFRAADPHLDQNLYQMLYALSRIDREPRYAREADTILAEFFRLAQSPRTGLFAWGEHLGIGFDDEAVQNALWLRGGRWAVRFKNRPIHEFFRPWALWSDSFRLDAERCVKFARGLWDFQIHEHSGDFSRHAGWDLPNPDPLTGSHFPRHGGFYIATWAHAYRHTRDPVFAQAIRTVLDFYDRIRDPEDKFVPMTDSGKNLSLEKGYESRSNLSLAIDLYAGAVLVDPELATRMRAFAQHEAELYLTLTPASIGSAGSSSGYGDVSAAGTGVLLYELARACGNVTLRDRLNHRALAYARAYLAGDPKEPRFLTPGNLGQAIWLMLDASAVSAKRNSVSRQRSTQATRRNTS